MLAKTWNPQNGRYDVTFDLPSDLAIEQAAVVGEFNDWSEGADRMTPDDGGRWSATLSLEPGRSYRFRYHLGDDRWENDWNADDYVPNDYGGADSVVILPDAPSEPPAAKKTASKKATGTKKKAAGKKAAAKKTTGTKKKAAAKKAAKKAGSTAKKGPGARP